MSLLLLFHFSSTPKKDKTARWKNRNLCRVFVMHPGPEVYHFILHARQTLSLLEEIVAAIKINFFILKMVSDNELDMSSGNKNEGTCFDWN